MVADYSSYVKSIGTYAPAFLRYNNSVFFHQNSTVDLTGYSSHCDICILILNNYWMETNDFNLYFLFFRLQTKVTIIPLVVGSNTQASPGNKPRPKLQAAKPSNPVVRIKPKPLLWWVWTGETKIVTTLALTLQLMLHPPGPKSNSRYEIH